MTIKPSALSLDGWTARARLPEPDLSSASIFPPLTLLLHGWLGDETVMWIFASRLPKHHLLVAPRAIYAPPQGGYGWVPRVDGFPTFTDFQPAGEALSDLLDKLQSVVPYDSNQVNLIGFSQGAALAHAFATLHPRRITAIAGLAGFVPPGIETFLPDKPLKDKRVFIAHGTKDETVPVSIARQGVDILTQLGAAVTYCEDEVGHKLGPACFRGLAEFFTQ